MLHLLPIFWDYLPPKVAIDPKREDYADVPSRKAGFLRITMTV